MLYGFLLTIFIINGLLLIFLILIQQSKSNMGLGSLSGSAQMLFGGSGGQDLFQKTTWVMGGIMMTLSLVLSLMKSSSIGESRYVGNIAQGIKQQVQQQQAQQTPAEPTTPAQPANQQ